MWSAGTKRRPAAYWLSQHRVARRLAGAPLELVATESVEQGLAQLKDWLAESSGRNGRLWLGGALCQLVAVPAVKGVGALKEAEAVAKLELQARGGVLEFDFKLHECDPVAAQWRATLTDRRLIGAEAELWQSKLASMKPWWSWALSHAASNCVGGALHQTLLAFDGETLVELSKDSEGRVTQAQTQSVVGGLEVLRRQLLRRQTVAGDAMLAGVAMNFNAERGTPDSARSAQSFPFEPWAEVVS